MDASPMAASNVASKTRSGSRLMSVDALRGFDMFWIIGAAGLARGLKDISDTGPVKFLHDQLGHVEWEGFVFYDLIFPLFVFLVGMSAVFSLSGILERSGPATAYKRIVRRFLILYLLGIIYYGGFSKGWGDIRLLGVLQRLALCYLFVGLIFCRFNLYGMVVICAGLLAGYWALMTYVPVPGVGAGCFEPGRNLANYIDSICLPGRKWDGTWDPEGLLSTFPAVGTCLIGCFAGMLLRNRSASDWAKVVVLLVGGAAGVAAGYHWGQTFPVIKKIWTSSYVLVAGGYSCILLGVFYLVLDVWKIRIWALPFVWIGMNALTIYMLSNILSFHTLAERFVGGNLNRSLFGHYGLLATAVLALGLKIGLVYFLYRKRIFIRA